MLLRIGVTFSAIGVPGMQFILLNVTKLLMHRILPRVRRNVGYPCGEGLDLCPVECTVYYDKPM